MINVSKPYLPSKEVYDKYLNEIWDRCWLTNNGPLVNELELKLKEYLQLEHLLFVNNGTVAIQIAIKALELCGTIVTTPFSYVATTNSIIWENCKPIFADIDEETLNIDPNKIEAVITSDTSAILATHVYGNPCDILAIQKIADEHGLKVIFDAAHCFGTKFNGKSVFEYGDISTASFHATKIFHTVEGGAIITKSPDLTFKMAKLRNFGHDGPDKYYGVGINGKNSEFHAAMGLANLQVMDEILNKRKLQYIHYQNQLSELNIRYQKITEGTNYNYAYFPIIFLSESDLLSAMQLLNDHYIYPRRYFYPSLNLLDHINYMPCAISEDISKRVLCLPIYHELKESEIDMIARVLLRTQRYYQS